MIFRKDMLILGIGIRGRHVEVTATSFDCGWRNQFAIGRIRVLSPAVVYPGDRFCEFKGLHPAPQRVRMGPDTVLKQ